MREVENRPGWGHFVLRTTIGSSRTETVVPAIDFDSRRETEDFFAEGLEQGKLLQAVRFGRQGMCGYKLNPQTEVTQMRSRFRTLGVVYQRNEFGWKNSIGAEQFAMGTIDSIDIFGAINKPNLEIEGTFENQPFAVQLFYVPSAT